MDMSLSFRNGDTEICAYEEARNSHRKLLHDAVERDLLAAGFKDVVALRSAFSGEASNSVVGNEGGSARRTKRKRLPSREGEVVLRRSTRRRATQLQQQFADEVDHIAEKKEHFRAWPGKEVQTVVLKKMTKTNVASKRKANDSPDPVIQTDEEDSEGKCRSSEVTKTKLASASEEGRPAIFEDDIRELQLARRPREIEGPQRPPAGGYRVEEQSRRGGQAWGEDYSPGYTQTPVLPYRGSYRRAWSPTAFGGVREYEERPGQYAPRTGHFEGRPQYLERRDPYYDGRGMESSRRAREYEDERRFEEPTYDRRGFHASDMYANGSQRTGLNQYAGTSRRGTSPLPSSSALVLNDGRAEFEGKRPIRLDGMGQPQGKMAVLFHSDIGSFVKDMDPNNGWEGQTKEAKDRLNQRLSHDYEYYGDSSILSEKYLRKAAGSALTQFRYTLNQLIDRGGDKPGDLRKEYWDALVNKRSSEEGKAKSVKMASIARGRGSKNTTKKSVEQAVLLKLTRDLKREPFDSEVENAVQKELAAIHELAAEKKRLKAAMNASNAAAAASAALEERLEIIEAFMRKWEPHFEVWKKMQLEVKNSDTTECTNGAEDTENPLALLPSTDNDQVAKAAEEEQTVISSEEEESSEESKSSDDEDSDFEEEAMALDEEETICASANPVKVVEPEECTVREDRKKTSEVVVTLLKGSALAKEAGRSIAQAQKSAEQVPVAQNSGSVRASSQEVGIEKKSTKNAIPKEQEKHSRSGKRQKVDLTSTTEVVLLDEDNVTKNGRKKDRPGKSSKLNRSRANAKTSEGKPRKGGKTGK